jgi:hypothetical protein
MERLLSFFCLRLGIAQKTFKSAFFGKQKEQSTPSTEQTRESPRKPVLQAFAASMQSYNFIPVLVAPSAARSATTSVLQVTSDTSPVALRYQPFSNFTIVLQACSDSSPPVLLRYKSYSSSPTLVQHPPPGLILQACSRSPADLLQESCRHVPGVLHTFSKSPADLL